MQKLTFTLLFFFLLLGSSQAQNFSLEIQIDNLESDEGKILLQVYTSDQEQEEVLHSEYFGRINEKSCTLLIKNLPPGSYGVQFFHDADSNGELNTNFIGIPKEDFGYSNNPKISFGPPDYEEWKFYLDSNMIISIDPISF